MKGTWRELAWLAASWPGRLEIRRRYSRRFWRLTAPLARLHRLTLARRVRLVVVVGSVAKTTTMRAMAAVLEVPVATTALLNANSFSAAAGQVLHLRPWQRHGVLEIGIGAPGQMAIHASSARPDVVVVTAIASDHASAFGSLEAIRDEKAAMVRALRPAGTALLNADDANVRWMAGQTRARVVLFGCAPDAEVRASDVELDWPYGTRFTAHVGGRSLPVRLRLLGRHMVYSALAAVAVAHVEGRPLEQAIAALAELAPTPGRMETIVLPSGAVIVQDDYKASEAAFGAALDTLAEVPARRRIVVFGVIGERPERENVAYRELARRVAAVADRAIFVGEKFKRYKPGAVGGGLDPADVLKAADWQAATAMLRADLRAGDVVLVKGRWQQALARVGLALAGRDVRCRADPCPFQRMLCQVCPFLEQPFEGSPFSPWARRRRSPPASVRDGR